MPDECQYTAKHEGAGSGTVRKTLFGSEGLLWDWPEGESSCSRWHPGSWVPRNQSVPGLDVWGDSVILNRYGIIWICIKYCGDPHSHLLIRRPARKNQSRFRRWVLAQWIKNLWNKAKILNCSFIHNCIHLGYSIPSGMRPWRSRRSSGSIL